jgi:uridine phosphorylase
MAGSKVPVYRVRIDLPPAYLASQAVAYGDAAGSEGAAPPYFNVPRYAAVIRTGMGAPMAAAFMEEVIAKGGRKFIVFGSCGLLAGDLPPGSIIIPDKARRDEGTSYHYAPAADYIKLKNAYYLAGLLNGLEIPHVLGGIWTTDALYRETKNNAAHRRAEGCIAVDMECSALQAVCDFRGCELYQFVYAEDSLVEDNWDPRNMGCVPAEQIEGHLKLAMEIARRV